MDCSRDPIVYVHVSLLGTLGWWIHWQEGGMLYSYCMNTALLVWIFVILWVIRMMDNYQKG